MDFEVVGVEQGLVGFQRLKVHGIEKSETEINKTE